jgi:uncharacterized protein YjiS (DUF1127 family)
MSKHSTPGWALFPRENAEEAAIHHQLASSTRAEEWLHTLFFWIDRGRQRSALGELAELDNYLLKDIGVSRDQALREAAKPFWR